MAQYNTISAIPFPDLLKVSSLVNPTRANITEVLQGYPDEVVDKLVALLNGHADQDESDELVDVEPVEPPVDHQPDHDTQETVVFDRPDTIIHNAQQSAAVFQSEPAGAYRSGTKQSLFQDFEETSDHDAPAPQEAEPADVPMNPIPSDTTLDQDVSRKTTSTDAPHGDPEPAGDTNQPPVTQAPDTQQTPPAATPAPPATPPAPPAATTASTSTSSRGGFSLAAMLKAAKDAEIERQRRVDPNDFEDIDRSYFADYDWSAQEVTRDTVHIIPENLYNTEDGSDTPPTMLIYWDPIDVPDDQVVLYLLVGDDFEQEPSPENGHELVVTRGTAFRETINEDAGMRHYMVWAYVTPEDALLDLLKVQPVFVGESAIALPPSDLKVVESDGVVTGTWTPKRGHANVMVYVRQSSDRRPLDSPENRLRDKVDARGFSYTVPVRGVTYDFQLFPEIVFRGNTMRGVGGEVRQLTISANIQQIELLEASLMVREEGTRGSGNDTILLSYIHPPTGEVKIYLTKTEPAPDLIGQEVDSSYLDDDDALGNTEWSKSYEGDPGEEMIKELSWPAGWSQVYCVPVNVVGEKSMVGEPKQIRRVESIKDFDLIQRVDSQLITFDWPSGAQMVEVRQEQKPMLELTEDDYRRQGGIRLHLNPLHDKVTLLPKAIHEGRYTKADHATSKDYPGLKLYAYKIEVPQEPGEGVLPKLWIWREDLEDRNQAPRFSLVYRSDRLPLYNEDGEEVIRCALSNDQRGAPGEPAPFLNPDTLAHGFDKAKSWGEYWLIDLPSEGPNAKTSGFIRLFIQPDSDDAATEKGASRVLIDDEAIDSLNLDDGKWSAYFYQRGY